MELHAYSQGDAVEISCARASLTGSAFRARYAATVLLAATTLLASNSTLHAAQKSDLEIGLLAQRVVRVGRVEKLVDQADIEPGQIVQYTAEYRNRSGKTLSKIAPTLPIPKGTEYVPESAHPAPSEASIDGNTFEAYPIRRASKISNGLEVMVDVPPTAYRTLRWSAGDLTPAASFTTSARVRILAVNE